MMTEIHRGRSAEMSALGGWADPTFIGEGQAMNRQKRDPGDATEGATLRVRLLGAPQITLDGEPLTGLTSAKAQALLFYLLVTGRAHTRSTLAGLLWGDFPQAAARTNLRKALHQLRKHLADYLSIDRDRVAVAEDADVWIDVVEFDTVLHEIPIAEDPERVRDAVELYRGDFLEGFYVQDGPDFEAWRLSEQSRLQKLLLDGLHDLGTYYADHQDLEAAIDMIRRALSVEPWREEAHRHLMTWLALSGQRGAALAQYESCRRVLADELGVEPADETRALYEQIREGRLRTAEAVRLHPREIEPALPSFLDPDAE